MPDGMRLQKFLSQTGAAARRKAEILITEGRIAVNGVRVTELGTKIDPQTAIVTLDGVAITPRDAHAYLMLHKPADYTCTLASFRKEKSIKELMPPTPHLFPIGRLDKDTEGLLLLTTDGDFAQHISHPKYGCTKTYEVTIRGYAPPGALEHMRSGIWLEDEDGTRKKMSIVKGLIQEKNKEKTQYILTLKEGHKRQIRRMFHFFGFRVEYLRRIAVGEVKLGSLPLGKCRPLTPHEKESLERTRKNTTAHLHSPSLHP